MGVGFKKKEAGRNLNPKEKHNTSPVGGGVVTLGFEIRNLLRPHS